MTSGEEMSFSRKFIISYLVGSATLAGYAIYGNITAGASSLHLLSTILYSPIAALFLTYDVLVLGKLKLIWGFFSFYFGFAITVFYFYLNPKIRRSKSGDNGHGRVE